MTKLQLAFAAAALVLATSCHYGVEDLARVPEQPTFNRDIYPLFADHCLVCHGSPPKRGAPTYFRLDVYHDVAGVAGAKSMAAAALADVRSGKMPPAARAGDGVGPNGIAALQKWVDDGAPQ
jgi:mono/diheme cytochrome c family protein